MNPSSLLIILITAVWVSVTTLSAATTNAAASIGPSVAGQVPVYTDTTGQLMTPSSSLTNFTFVTPVITAPGGYYSGAMLTPWVNTNNTMSLQWRKAPVIWEFIQTASEGWSTFNFNSGSASFPASAVDLVESGIGSFSTGSLTNGGAGLRGSGTSLTFVTNSMALLWRIKTPSALSSNSDGYEIYAGFGDVTTDTAPTDGAYFYYLHSVSNGVWCAKTVSNTSATFASGAAETPPTVAIDTWYSLLIEASSNVANFWVSTNDGESWQWIGFCSANIPATTARLTGPECYIRKVGGSVGTTSRTAYAGRCEFWPNRGN